MLETMQPSPEERMQGYKKFGKESAANTKRIKANEIEDDMDKRIAGWQKEGRQKEIMTELRAKLKKIAEEKKKLKEGIVTSEENTFVSGEINNEDKFGKRRTNENVISRAAYEAEKIKIAREKLTEAARKSAAEDAELSPQNIETIKRAAAKEEAEYIKRNQKFAATNEETEEYKNRNQELAGAKQALENRKEMLSKALIQAYKEKGVKVTKDNEADFLIEAPPLSYIFSAKGRKIRDLYARYIKEVK